MRIQGMVEHGRVVSDAGVVVSQRIGDVGIDVDVERCPSWIEFIKANAGDWPLAENAWVNLFGVTIDGEEVEYYVDRFFWLVDGEWTSSHPELETR